MPAPDRITGNQSDYHLGHGTDKFLQVENIETGNALIVNIASLSTYTLIPTGTESIFPIGMWTRTGEQNHSDFWILPGIEKGLIHFTNSFGPKGI